MIKGTTSALVAGQQDEAGSLMQCSSRRMMIAAPVRVRP
jgi:hypothetical protein